MPEEQVKDIQQSEPVVDIPTEGDPVDIELKEDSSPKDQGTEQKSEVKKVRLELISLLASFVKQNVGKVPLLTTQNA